MERFCKIILYRQYYEPFYKLCPEWPILKYRTRSGQEKLFILRKIPIVSSHLLFVNGYVIEIDDSIKGYRMVGKEYSTAISQDNCILFKCMDYKEYAHMMDIHKFVDNMSRYIENFNNMFEIERLSDL
jgi:hypothetical protein